MKKKLLLILMFMTMFIVGNNDVSADECNARGYKTICTYEIAVDSPSRPSKIYLYYDSENSLISYDHGVIHYEMFNNNNNPEISSETISGNYFERVNYINASSLNNGCPENIYYYLARTTRIPGQIYKYYNHWRVEESEEYQVDGGILAEHSWTPYKLENSCVENEIDINDDEIDCSLIDSDLTKIINDVMNIIRIAIPLLLIGLITYDFAIAVFSNDEKSVNKAKSNAIKRIIIAVVIFFIPMLINLIFNIANEVWVNANYEICGLDK